MGKDKFCQDVADLAAAYLEITREIAENAIETEKKLKELGEKPYKGYCSVPTKRLINPNVVRKHKNILDAAGLEIDYIIGYETPVLDVMISDVGILEFDQEGPTKWYQWQAWVDTKTLACILDYAKRVQEDL